MMDESESTAYEYLKHLGYDKIIYEPDGHSKPPDFLVDDRIAVEVRRLNQNEVVPPGAKAKGLEEVAIPVSKNLVNLLPSLGPPTGPVSWYVYIRYSRPVPGTKKVNAAVLQHLKTFRDTPDQKVSKIPLFKNFTLQLFPAGKLYKDFFVPGGRSDYDSGGWVLPEVTRNLKICIDDKTAKMSAIRAKYQEWWLLLIDHINYGAAESIETPVHNWDKIVLINPLDHRQAFDVT